ncbi:MAG TPA: ABC transporter permease [Burkholderiales bacterium]|nr:ABC transporter permease [Burkholderiales bacterium]
MERLRNAVADFIWLAAPFLLLAASWEAVAYAEIFPQKLFPRLQTVAATFWQLTTSGIIWENTEGTLLRLTLGFLLAAVVGVTVGILMGRFRVVEDILLPTVTFGYPIPGLAYAPLFVLWFGLGDVPAVLLVGVASCFIIIVNSWKGVKAVKPVWLRAAQVMGAGERQIFWKIMIPGALPYILTGLRLGLAQAWRILVAVEMLMSVERGLGWMIFGAQQFLNTDVMLSGIAVIGLVGVLLEKQVFERLERYTVVRWGMLTA